MLGLNGLELQEALAGRGRAEQVIFITSGASVPTCLQAMKAGAVDYLPKPFDDENLLSAVKRALERSSEQWLQHSQRMSRSAGPGAGPPPDCLALGSRVRQGAGDQSLICAKDSMAVVRSVLKRLQSVTNARIGYLVDTMAESIMGAQLRRKSIG
jgi:DNA-binding NtrC family response regulator